MRIGSFLLAPLLAVFLSALAIQTVAGRTIAPGTDLPAVPQSTPDNAAFTLAAGEGATAANVTIEIVDALGRSFFVPFALLGNDGKTLSVQNAANPTAIVAPGIYVVEPMFDPLLGREVELRPGEARIVRIEAPKHVGLLLERYDSKLDRMVRTRVPLRLKDRAAMRQAFAKPPPETVARRARATSEAVAAARALARERLKAALTRKLEAVAAYNRAFETPPMPDQATIARLRREMMQGKNPLRWARRILLIAGDANDAARAVALARTQPKGWEREELVWLAAQIENRIGILDSGAVAMLLADADDALAFTAARALHAHGVPSGDSILLARLRAAENVYPTAAAAWALLDVEGPKVRAAMAEVLRAATAVANDDGQFHLRTAGWRAALYLLAYGTPAERRLAAGYPIPDEGFGLLAGMLADPRPLIDYSLGLDADGQARFDANRAAWFCPQIARLPRADAERIERHIENAILRIAAEQDITGLGNEIMNRTFARWLYDLARGDCRASRTVAELVHGARFDPGRFHRRLEKLDWIPRTWAADDLITAFAAGDGSLDAQLEYLPHERIVAALDGGKAGSNVPEADLFIAYHAIGSSACAPERCAFVLTNADNPQGALAAVVRLRPELIETTLRVELAFDLAAYVKGGLAAMIGPPTRSYESYLASRGESMVARVVASRGGTAFPLAPAGRAADGEGLIFEGALDAADLHDLYLHVELQVLDTPWTLDFALFATEYAKARTRARARTAAAARAVAANERDTAAWIAWGDALAAMGRIDAAQEKYARAIAFKPNDIALWAEVADRLAADGHSKAARALLAQAVAANPDALGLLLKLANLCYRDGAYGAAARAYGRLAARRADDPRWRWWEALARFLASDYGAANAILRGGVGDYQAERVPVLRYLSARLGKTADAGPAESALRALSDAAADTVRGRLYGLLVGAIAPERAVENIGTKEELCRARLYLGYRALIADEWDAARDHLGAAERTCRAGGIEHRLAQAARARLPAVQ